MSGPGRCALCEGSDPLGLGVCLGCGGAPARSGDALIFVTPDDSGNDRRLIARLRSLTNRAIDGRGLELAGTGHRALLRVPDGVGERVVAALAARGVPAETRYRLTARPSLPRSFVGLVALTATLGTWAGLAAQPLLLWTTPLVAALLTLGAHLHLLKPVLVSPRTSFPFSLDLGKTIMATFGRLPGGTAREQLAALIRAAEPAYRSSTADSSPVSRGEIDQLLRQSCRAAVDLSDLHVALATSSRRDDRMEKLAERVEDRFRQGIAVMHRLRAGTIESDPVHRQFEELISQLDEDTAAYAEAIKELG